MSDDEHEDFLVAILTEARLQTMLLEQIALKNGIFYEIRIERLDIKRAINQGLDNGHGVIYD